MWLRCILPGSGSLRYVDPQRNTEVVPIVSRLMESTRTGTCQHRAHLLEEDKNTANHEKTVVTGTFIPLNPCPSGTHSKVNQYICFMYDPDIFQTVASVLRLRVIEFVHGLFERRDQVSHCPRTFLDISLTGSLNQVMWASLPGASAGLPCW